MSDLNDHQPTDDAVGDLADWFAEHDAHDTSLDDTNAQIGLRITEARVTLDDSVAVVAERVGVTAQTFEEWESGGLPVRANHLNRLAGVLGISLSWLIMGRGAEPMADSSELSRLRADLAAALSRLDDVVNELTVIDQRLAQLDEG
jgi:transcriptional regulator with XRE-family HTH domain